MKKLIAVIIFISCFCSCNKNIDSETTIAEQKPKSWTEEIIYDSVLPVPSETENKVFYFDKGIYSYDLGSQEKLKLSNETAVSKLCLYENFLYYLSNYDEIKRINLSNNKKEIVWSAKEHEDMMILEQIQDFKIYNDNIYIYDSGISLLSYSLKNHKTEHFLDDVASLTFFDNEVFFTKHAARDFTIYKKALNNLNAKPQIVKGNGKKKNAQSTSEMYDNITNVNGEIYYTKRSPAQIYMLNPKGEDVLIADFSQDKDVLIIFMYEFNNNLYFAPDNENKNGKLYCYKPETKNIYLAFANASFNPYFGFSIVNDFIFFKSDDSSNFKCQKL